MCEQAKRERGQAVERAWAQFFRGSVLAEDVIPLKGAARMGHEQGCDLWLVRPWSETAGGLQSLQVKSGLKYAIQFLHEGGIRGEIIPCVVGIPPVEGFQRKVLRDLSEHCIWFPRQVWIRRDPGLVEELDQTLRALRQCRVKLRQQPPPWCRAVQ